MRILLTCRVPVPAQGPRLRKHGFDIGFHALASTRADDVVLIDPEDRLERGPAYGAKLKPVKANDSDWATYRGNARRSGSTPADFATLAGKAEILALLQARRDNAAKPTRWFSKLIGWVRK